jgi:hypothetical protein
VHFGSKRLSLTGDSRSRRGYEDSRTLARPSWIPGMKPCTIRPSASSTRKNSNPWGNAAAQRLQARLPDSAVTSAEVEAASGWSDCVP